MCFPEDLHFYMEKAHLLSKNAHFFNAPFWLIFIEAFKMAENHEKTCFTFFAFLPPSFGGSGSLVPRNG